MLLRHALVLLGHAATHACVCGVVGEGGIDLLAREAGGFEARAKKAQPDQETNHTHPAIPQQRTYVAALGAALGLWCLVGREGCV